VVILVVKHVELLFFVIIYVFCCFYENSLLKAFKKYEVLAGNRESQKRMEKSKVKTDKTHPGV